MYRQNNRYAQAKVMFELYMKDFPDGKEIHQVTKKYEKIKFK